MPIYNMYSVFDSAVKAYQTPFYAQHAGIAIRGFTDAVRDPRKDSDVSRHPQDFELHELGNFNSDTGSTVSIDPKLIVTGKAIASEPEFNFGNAA